jgi:lambda family phage portal protein
VSVASNLFERVLGYVVPRRALARELARSRMNGVLAARMQYEGATTSRRSQGWRVVSTDANAEVLAGRSRLRDVARDMVRNNPHAARAKQVIAHNVVGKGILPSALSTVEQGQAELERLLKAHFDTTACDVLGRHNLAGLEALVMGTVVEAGECLVRMRPRRASDKLPLPFQLQVMEPDHLDAAVNGRLPNGNVAIQGVEFTRFGKIVAYHLFNEHPGSLLSGFFPSHPVPAEFVAHIFRTDRPGQARGVTWFAPIILRLRDRADVADAYLMRQKIAACFAAFIHSNDEFIEETNADGTPKVNDRDVPLETIEPGMIERLRDGEQVSFGNPPGVGDYGDYMMNVDREVAVGLGISYESLTGDLSNVNFSSGRMGWLEFQRSIDAWRGHMLRPQLCDRIGQWFLDAAAVELGRRWPAEIIWSEPRREMINPAQEVPATIKAIRGGLTSRSEEQRNRGFDPADLDAEIAADNARADDNGLIFDSDPRKVTNAGNPVEVPDFQD